MKSVIERKKVEDEAIGAPKIRKESSYIRLKDAEGNFVEPIFIVRDRKTSLKRFLQVFINNTKDLRPETRKTTERFYKDGIEIQDDDPIMKEVIATRKIKPRHGATETWVLSLDKITKII